MLKSAVIYSVAVLTLAACGPTPSELEKQRLAQAGYSFQELEQTRKQAMDNALFNARIYFNQNPRFEAGSNIVPHTDSTIGPKCRNGDGWATLSIINVTPSEDSKAKKNLEKFVLKCSTISQSIGCYLDQDFKKKSTLSEQDGTCQAENVVPYPLPVLAR